MVLKVQLPCKTQKTRQVRYLQSIEQGCGSGCFAWIRIRNSRKLGSGFSLNSTEIHNPSKTEVRIRFCPSRSSDQELFHPDDLQPCSVLRDHIVLVSRIYQAVTQPFQNMSIFIYIFLIGLTHFY